MEGTEGILQATEPLMQPLAAEVTCSSLAGAWDENPGVPALVRSVLS